jgi:hypothetical protein
MGPDHQFDDLNPSQPPAIQDVIVRHFDRLGDRRADYFVGDSRFGDSLISRARPARDIPLTSSTRTGIALAAHSSNCLV